MGVHGGESFTVIAGRLGRAVSTVSREVAADGGRDGYRAWRTHRRARERVRPPKGCKLDDPVPAAAVSAELAGWWSPQQIAARLRIAYPHDPMMQVSHEMIYQGLYVQGRGELRREMARCLRSRRAGPSARRAGDGRGKIPGIVMTSERAAEAANGAVAGHWKVT